jgi:hypothetical protein
LDDRIKGGADKPTTQAVTLLSEASNHILAPVLVAVAYKFDGLKSLM